MKMKFNKKLLLKVANGLHKRSCGRFWRKETKNRFYLSDGMCCEISSRLKGGETVSPYFDLDTNELIGNYAHNSALNADIEKIAFDLIKKILTSK